MSLRERSRPRVPQSKLVLLTSYPVASCTSVSCNASLSIFLWIFVYCLPYKAVRFPRAGTMPILFISDCQNLNCRCSINVYEGGRERGRKKKGRKKRYREGERGQGKRKGRLLGEKEKNTSKAHCLWKLCFATP